jgi:hypothetical protein
MKTAYALLALSFALSLVLPTASFAFTPDVEIMNLKGYSPETIQATMAIRSRAEWRGISPSPRPPFQKFMYNLLHGKWVDTIDEPGHDIIRRD